MIKNYYAKQYLQEDLKKYITKNEKIILGTFVQPTSGFFDFQDQTILSFESLKVIEDIHLNVLEEIKKYPNTIKTFINFIKDLKLYGITLESLPKNNLIQKDIYQVCSQLWPLINQPKMLNDSDYVLKTGLSFAEYNYAKNNLIDLEVKSISKSIRYFYAQNKRQEIEAVFQDIAKLQLEKTTIVVPNTKEYLPLIESVIKRFGYQIKLQANELYIIKKQYLASLNFHLHQDLKSFITLIQSNLLDLNYPNLYLEYIKHFNLEINHLSSNLDYARDQNHPIYTIQEKLEKDHAIIQDFLRRDFGNSYLESHTLTYNLLAEKYGSKLNQFRILIETYDRYFTHDNHEIILSIIENFTPKKLPQENLKIYDYNNLPLTIEGHVYYLGLTAQNYPGIAENTGIIDENFLRQIAGYPSQQERVEYDLARKRRIYELGTSQTFSYPISNYEGKALEPAYEIKEYCESKGIKANLWPLINIRSGSEKENNISPDLAKKLFLSNDKLYASVSSLQRYVSAPEDYFFEYGLKVREPKSPDFNALILGNLNHKIVETKDNDQSWESIYDSYPREDLHIKMIKDRNDKMMQENMELLNIAEKETMFKPQKFEVEVSGNQIIPQVYLKGFVDRIDFADRFFTIIDYKSSSTALSLGSLINGTQLQLLTYAHIISRLEQKQALSIMYYSFAQPNTLNAKIYKYSVSNGILKQSQDFSEEYIKEKRYNAWFFADIGSLFNTDIYWKGLRDGKEGITVSYHGKYNYDMLIEILKNRYEIIYNLISKGIFDSNEIEQSLEVSDETYEEWKEAVKA